MTQTKRTTKFPTEEIYTEADRAGSHDGIFTFYAPMSWAGDITLDKAVAVRRAKVVPPALIIPFGIRFNFPYKSDGHATFSYHVYDYYTTIIITSETTLYDILNKIADDVAQIKVDITEGSGDETTTYEITAELKCDYDNITHQLTITALSRSDDVMLFAEATKPPTEFRFFVDTYYNTYNHGLLTYPTNNETTIGAKSKIDMLQTLFNQITLSNTLFSSINGVLTLNHVWDRQNLEIHASFSNSKNRFIAVNGDFFQSRNMIFNARNGFNAFDVWFSTDGTHRIPISDKIHFILQLTFINQIEISYAKDY